jgi:hypothetical protein
MKPIINVFVLFILIFITGCDKEFNPVTEPQEEMVVVGILNSKDEPQYIKIQKSYSQLNSDTSEKTLRNLNVTLVENTSTVYDFVDTTISGVSNYSVYYNKNFRTKKTVYYIEVYGNGYPDVYATAMMPSNVGNVIYEDNYLSVILSSKAYSYTYEYHIYIDFNQPSGENSISKRCEVPIGININGKDTSFTYPELDKVKRTSDDTVKISYDNFSYAMSKIKGSVAGDNLGEFKCFVVFTTIEANLLKYLFGGFNDSYTVRLDQPNWSNLIDGEGVFGAVSFDSIEVIDILPNLKRGK